MICFQTDDNSCLCGSDLQLTDDVVMVNTVGLVLLSFFFLAQILSEDGTLQTRV